MSESLIHFDYSRVSPLVTEDEFYQFITAHQQSIESAFMAESNTSEHLGWIEAVQENDSERIAHIEAKAREVREHADVFVVIGVGGSNQGARAAIHALSSPEQRPEILYAGNTLSPAYLNAVFKKLTGKSVYCNVIAKNFATLEPGSTFRLIRQFLEDTYGEQEAGQRIIATGSLNQSRLEVLGKNKGYTLFPFPLNVGGRFSVLTPVGLFPIAVTGINIRQLLYGAAQMYRSIQQHVSLSQPHPVLVYAALRNLLLQKGYHIEILSHFEPCLHYFAAWWVQLFGESEGKQGEGIFPTSCSFTEDLHALGQYIQEGQRILMETFVHIQQPLAHCPIPPDAHTDDDFNYLDNKDYAELNEHAYQGTIDAHRDGGVPCMSIHVPELNEYYVGQLFFFFEYACYLSATILGVNPFDQPGVEAYKQNMFRLLGKM
jgi:glucose-6-phosphate isomerase